MNRHTFQIIFCNLTNYAPAISLIIFDSLISSLLYLAIVSPSLSIKTVFENSIESYVSQTLRPTIVRRYIISIVYPGSSGLIGEVFVFKIVVADRFRSSCSLKHYAHSKIDAQGVHISRSKSIQLSFSVLFSKRFLFQRLHDCMAYQSISVCSGGKLWWKNCATYNII